MRDGRERKIRSSSFFYQNMASREQKYEQIPVFLPLCQCGLAAMQQRGYHHRLLYGMYCCLFLSHSGLHNSKIQKHKVTREKKTYFCSRNSLK